VHRKSLVFIGETSFENCPKDDLRFWAVIGLDRARIAIHVFMSFSNSFSPMIASVLMLLNGLIVENDLTQTM
jgi:hypothetical protein